MSSHQYNDVDVFCAGTVGAPGERVFFLQCRAGGDVLTVKLEKQQVAILAQSVDQLVQDLPAPGPLPTDLDLAEPVDPAFVVGDIGLGWDADLDRVVVLLEEQPVDEAGRPRPPEEADEDEDLSSARILLTLAQAVGFAQHASGLVAAGRPRCIHCGNPRGVRHVCPRSNGHKKR